MIRAIMFLAFFAFTHGALAQEWGASVGVHQTTADSNTSGASVDGNLNYKAGVLVSFELAEKTRFRSGLLYNQRHFDVTSGGAKYEYNFSYFDVPANLQYNLNETLGFFGGLVIAVKSGDHVEVPVGSPAVDPDAEGMIALMDLGVNLLFNDMIGFDFYYERGLGKFADHLENFSTFGGNFIFWF